MIMPCNIFINNNKSNQRVTNEKRNKLYAYVYERFHNCDKLAGLFLIYRGLETHQNT